MTSIQPGLVGDFAPPVELTVVDPADDPQTELRVDYLRARLLNTADLDALPEPAPIIDEILYADGVAWLHGKPGHCKSLLALDWAGCVGGGLPWQRSETTQGNVLYVYAEGRTGLRARVRAWEVMTGVPMDGVLFLPVPVQLLEVRDVQALQQICADVRPVLVVLDTQARVTVGAEENSAKDMGLVVRALERIRDTTAAAVLVVHHESRAGENLRGSTALEGAANTQIRVSADGLVVSVECTKQKDAEPFSKVLLQRSSCRGSVVLAAFDQAAVSAVDLPDSARSLLGVLRESFGSTGASATTLQKTSAVPSSTFYRQLNLLVRLRLVRNVGTATRTRYVVDDEEQQQ